MIDWYMNFNIDNIVTLLNTDNFEQLLCKTGYDKKKLNSWYNVSGKVLCWIIRIHMRGGSY